MNQNLGLTYSPLEHVDSIRLLLIEDVDHSIREEWENPQQSFFATDDLSVDPRCHLRHFNLANAPPYRALSYEWGSTDVRSIILNGQRVDVRNNLWNALWHIRYKKLGISDSEVRSHRSTDLPKWIWVDSLCIDQENNSERNHQVSVMGQIYKRAFEVLMWLGRSADTSDGFAISRAMTEMGKLALNTGNLSISVANELVHDVGLYGILRLFDLPYWRRMWIIQEIVLASNITILFDKISVPWSGLTALRMLLAPQYTSRMLALEPRIGATLKPIEASQGFALDSHRTQSYGNTLAELVMSSILCDCTDPRDKLYGLIGLAEDCQANTLPVDYSKPLFEVYLDAMKFHYDTYGINEDASMTLVAFSQSLQQSFNHSASLEWQSQTSILHSRANSGRALPLMHVRGIRAGTVEKFGETFDKSFVNSVPHHNHNPYLSPSQSSLMRETSQTLRDIRTVVPIHRQSSFALDPKDISNVGSLSRSLSSSQLRKTPGIDGNRPFTMDTGQPGYVPAGTQKGDIICQFLNCDVAVALRKNEIGYQILGRALVAKSASEYNYAEARAKTRYNYSIPNAAPDFKWTLEQELHLYLDLATLQLLTA